MLFGAALCSAIAFLLWRHESHTPPPPTPKDKLEQIATISSPEEFEDLCANMVSDKEIFDACRRKLPVFELSYRWLDTRLLVKPDETLSLDHLGLLYGLEGTEGEAARHAIGTILAAECRRGRRTSPSTFEQLMDPHCKQALPTLTQMGLELDREWMGVRSIDSDYVNAQDKSR
jgi:hypothetical protein